ncbi:RNA polymerase sigma factor SigZ [Photobacterium jeanii]|uniref:RNA polymerase sigma factor n=1 Tax=Photobacterium jeanii TaxID=858640 RepID=A0A178K303_9GAMM|nr:RNA polymerase sigma factor SigZ [Photobacterium jeanii]OAN11708.1 RNA polymerase sigma factor SigZ [Photobacterium jeanii]PST91242.1 RNA polymerase sigma factor SigZ [Photobacterium jeanii]
MNVEHIWGEYRSSLQAFLRKNVSNAADVDDLLQEVLIKTYTHMKTIKDPSQIKSWLFQVANNAIIDFYRKQGRQRLVEGEELWHAEDDSSVHNELSQCLTPFIQALPEGEAQMLTAIEINGESQKSYAEKQGVKYSTLKSRVNKSREHLLELYKECCDFTLDANGNLMDYEQKPSSCNKC